ncbi:MAG: DUF3794 domain-containing protein [Candidatus Desulforudis sp.]|nr:DUF3794 domain-containing protein [Desulforudis sp.]
MSHRTLIKADVVIGEGKTQILIEKQFMLKWPLKKVVDEQFDVDIFHTEVCTDKVLFNGEVQKNLIFKTPFEKKWRTEEEESEDETRHFPPPEVIEQQDGFVVFHEEVIQFAGFVNVKGARAGDHVQILEAAVKDCTAFIPTKVDKNDLVLEGKQKFIVDVVIKVTRKEQIWVDRFPADKKRDEEE